MTEKEAPTWYGLSAKQLKISEEEMQILISGGARIIKKPLSIEAMSTVARVMADSYREARTKD